MSVSLPAPPRRTSSFHPPQIVSAPLPPVIESLPLSPCASTAWLPITVILSAPSRPLITMRCASGMFAVVFTPLTLSSVRGDVRYIEPARRTDARGRGGEDAAGGRG